MAHLLASSQFRGSTFAPRMPAAGVGLRIASSALQRPAGAGGAAAAAATDEALVKTCAAVPGLGAQGSVKLLGAVSGNCLGAVVNASEEVSASLAAIYRAHHLSAC
mgnify:CR=1 FL=1